MPTGISNFEYKHGALEDIKDNFTSQQQDRIKSKLEDIKTNCVLGSRDPRLHRDYKKIDEIGEYNIYRKWVGNSLARLFFAVTGHNMILISVLPKDDDTYQSVNYYTRL